MWINNVRIGVSMELLRQLAVEKPLYLVLGALILILWGFEKWIFSISTWVPLLVSVWATIQYASHQRQITVEELNRKWKRVVLESSAVTAVEQCEWVNKLLTEIWPNFFSPMLSTKFSSIVEKRLKRRIPSFIEKIEIQEFSVGSSPPTLALDGIRWSTFGDQKMMHFGVEWDTRLCIVLLAKLAKPLNGTARIVINHIYIKGDVQLMPILEGKAILYSFLSSPLVKIDVAFGSGSCHLLPATELPGVSSWLGKLLSDTLAKTMVEPRRQCSPLLVVRTRKKVVAGVIHVTVVGANQICRAGFKGCPSRRQQNYTWNGGCQEDNPVDDLHTLVEVQLEQLTRRTDVKQGSNPTWNSTFNMVLHNSSGILKFRLYECNPGSAKYDYLASSEIKVRYCQDDSTIFWAIGPNSSAIAKQVGICGQEVEMTVPFEGTNSREIKVRLVLQEWQFSDGLQSLHLQHVNGSTNIPSMTGRKVYVTLAEAKNLARKDESGKINPYVKLHYGKTTLRTRTMLDGAIPTWNEKFEFEELGGGEYLTLRCYSEDTFGDEHIGSARVNLERITEGSVKEEWIPLEKVNSGDIRLLIEVVRMDNNQGPSSKGSPRGTSNGWIELVLVEAKDLIAADLRGTSDPYVKVKYGNLKKRTKVVYRTLNPHWNQTLEFTDDGSPLSLYVKDHNDILAPSSIGECQIEYQRLPLNQTYDKWIPLQGVTKGEIHVLITRKLPEILDKQSGFDSDSSVDKAHSITYQMKQLLMKLQLLVGEGDLQNLSKTVSELETFEEIQEEYMLQLEIEKSLLLNKVAVLDEEMSTLPSSSGQSPGNLTSYSKSLP